MTEIIHKRGRGEPTPDAFAEVGELAIDIETGRVYTLTEANTVVCVGSENPGGGGAEAIEATYYESAQLLPHGEDTGGTLREYKNFWVVDDNNGEAGATRTNIYTNGRIEAGGVDAYAVRGVEFRTTTKYGKFQGVHAFFRDTWTVENTVFGGINIVGADAERPEDLPYSPDEKSVQHAFTVTHEKLGRTVEIDKEGIIRALDLQSIRGNQLFVKPSDVAEAFTTLQKALSDEDTLEGVKSALTNSLGGLIEKFEAMQSAVTQEASDE